MLFNKLSSSFCIILLLAVSALFASDARAEAPGENVLCAVCGSPVQAENYTMWKNCKLYFACGGCAEEFATSTEEYIAKANGQLVVSGQAAQVACPLTGKKAQADCYVEINDVKIGLCCPDCRTRVENAEGDAKFELLFGEPAFKKGFKVKQEG